MEKFKVDDWLIIIAFVLPLIAALYLTIVNADAMDGYLVFVIFGFISIPLIVIALLIHFIRYFKSKNK